jgi:hypothetical protein
MKLLMTRLAAGGLLGMSGSGMINRRRCFTDLVPNRRHMVTPVTRQMELEPMGQAPSPAPATADDPRRMVLNRWVLDQDHNYSLYGG